MFTTKRFSILVLVALLCLMLIIPGAQAQDAASATIPAVSCAQPGTLTLRVWDENWAKTLQAATAAWVQEYCPGADVTVEQVAYGQYWTVLPTDAAGGTLPDVFNMSQDNFFHYADSGALLDLQPYFDQNELDPTVWGSGLVNPYRYGPDNDVYGAPLEWVTAGIYYNKDMFDGAGLAYPTAAWTWDDFATAADALTDTANGVYGAGVYAEVIQGYGSWIASAGVTPVVTADHSACTLTEPGSVEALNFLKALLDKGDMPTISAMGGSSADNEWDLFKSDKIAMVSNGTWKLPNAPADLTFNWDVVQFPHNPTTGLSRSMLHATSWAAAANTPNPELAANLIQYLVSDEGQKFFADAGGVAPSNPNPALQQEWIDSFGGMGVNIQAFVDASKNSQGVSFFNETGKPTSDMMVNIFDLGMSVEDATAQACSEIQPFLTPAT